MLLVLSHYVLLVEFTRPKEASLAAAVSSKKPFSLQPFLYYTGDSIEKDAQEFLEISSDFLKIYEATLSDDVGDLNVFLFSGYEF